MWWLTPPGPKQACLSLSLSGLSIAEIASSTLSNTRALSPLPGSRVSNSGLPVLPSHLSLRLVTFGQLPSLAC